MKSSYLLRLSTIFRRTAVFAALTPAMLIAAEMPTPEQMWAIIQQQQQQIADLTKRVEAAEAKSSQAEIQIVEAVSQVQETDAKIEATSAYVETLADQQGAGGSGNNWYDRTSLGGYGEMHLNFGSTDMIDFHRWVLFIGHEFNDTMRVFSEFELEHSLAGDGAPGEVELEQAYVEFDLSAYSKARAGMFLLPIGMLNEIHEPNTFFGVERNNVEKNIIPTTWWEGGAGFTQTTDSGWAFDYSVHSGLNVPTTGSKAFNIRSGRQKLAEAEMKAGAGTVRAKYTGIPGFEFAASAQYQQDMAQGSLNESISATLLTTHIDWQRDGFGFKALYARWDIDGRAPALLGRDEQFGYYLEPSYRWNTEFGDWGVFARYSTYDLSANSIINTANEYYDFGVNYWPHPNIVFKADVQLSEPANGNDEETVNLGVGYMF